MHQKLSDVLWKIRVNNENARRAPHTHLRQLATRQNTPQRRQMGRQRHNNSDQRWTTLHSLVLPKEEKDETNVHQAIVLDSLDEYDEILFHDMNPYVDDGDSDFQ